MRTVKTLCTAFLGLAAGLLLAGVPAAAQEGCRHACNGDCDMECSLDGLPSTCFDWYHRSSDDGDGDGLDYWEDNCPCAANADQADCDDDGTGDVCDAVNEKWVFVQDLGRCETDSDVHWNHFTVEQFGARRYVNECDSSECVDRYLLSSVNCNFSTQGCGTSAGACCNCYYQFSWCTGITTCGGPDCPF